MKVIIKRRKKQEISDASPNISEKLFEIRSGERMELRQLECFCAVSSLENFTKAAQFLHISQPSVTKTVQSLESELNLELFDRKQKHVCLTDAGQVFLIHAKKILQDVQMAQVSLERFRVPKGGVIKLGVPPMVESYLFPNFFVKFMATNPKIFLELQEFGDSNIIREKLDGGELDFGIIFLNPEEHSEKFLILLEDEFYLCLPTTHRLANEKKISFDELHEEKFILQPNGTFQNFVTIERAAVAGFSPKILLTTSQFKTIKELVANGVAVSLLPKFAIKKSTEFKTVPINPPIRFAVALAGNKFKELSPLCLHFFGFVETIFHDAT